MKTMLILAVLLLFSGVASAQSLELDGAEIQLGMSAKQVSDALPDVNLHPDGTVWSVHPTDGKNLDLYGQIIFTNGRVSYVSRDWLLNNVPDTQAGFALSVYGAVKSLTNGRNASCLVSANNAVRPNSEDDGIEIKCVTGNIQKMVTIHGFTTSSPDALPENAEVQESIEYIGLQNRSSN